MKQYNDFDLIGTPEKAKVFMPGFRRNSKPDTHCRQQRGFTLIELMIVITIIVILAGLLLPSLKKARDQSYRITCAKGESQLLLLLQFYRNDYNEYMPFSLDYTTANIWWYFKLAPAYMPLQNFKELAECKGEPKRDWTYAYSVNDKMMGRLKADGTVYQFYGIKCIALKKPSHTFLLMDGKTGYGVVNSVSNTNPEITGCTVEFAHIKGLNTGYADGHVKWLKRRLGGFTNEDIAIQGSNLYE